MRALYRQGFKCHSFLGGLERSFHVEMGDYLQIVVRDVAEG